MSLTTTLTDSTYFRNHAVDQSGATETNGVLGSGRTLQGGPDQFIEVPSAYSLDDLEQGSFSFSTWIRLVNLPDDKSSDSFYAQGYQTVPNDSYFNDIESLRSLGASGGRVFRTGPRQGLYIEGTPTLVS